MNDELNVETPAEPVAKTKKQLSPVLKKALIWGGVALGAVAAFALFRSSPSDDDTATVIVVDESVPANDTTVTQDSD